MFNPRQKGLITEVLAIGALIVHTVQLSDELKRLYQTHKPKHTVGFARELPRERRIRFRR